MRCRELRDCGVGARSVFAVLLRWFGASGPDIRVFLFTSLSPLGLCVRECFFLLESFACAGGIKALCGGGASASVVFDL